MRNTLSIATGGYLTTYKKSLSIGVDGYLYGNTIVIPEPVLKPVYRQDNSKAARGYTKWIDDDEVLLILKIFMECQQLK